MKIMKLGQAIILSFLVMGIFPSGDTSVIQTTRAWGNNPVSPDNGCDVLSSHDKIIQKAIDGLRNSGYSAIAYDLTLFEDDLCNAQAATDLDGDVHSTYDGWHIYTSTKKPEAAFNDEFDKAKSASTRTSKVNYLGRAIHFVQDMTQPFHASGIGVNKNDLKNDPHFLYETLATDTSIPSSLTPITYNPRSGERSGGLWFFDKALSSGQQNYDEILSRVTGDFETSVYVAQSIAVGLSDATRLVAGLLLYYYNNYWEIDTSGGGGSHWFIPM